MKKTRFITQAAVIAACYTVLTYLGAPFASGAIQVRLAEALCILPVFTPAAIPGLAIGCLTANLLTGSVIWDVIFGSLATLIGAIGTYLLRKKPYLATVPPIISNVLIVPFILAYAYHAEGTIGWFMITVGIGEVISCGIIGSVLMFVMKRHDVFNNMK